MLDNSLSRIITSSCQQQQQFTLEMTVVSAQGLKNSSSCTLFSHRLRPFITLTAFPQPPTIPFGGDGVYQTRVDDQGGVNPTWGDKFHVPIDDAFFANRYSGIYLQLFTKRLIAGPSQLGWCQIPAADIGLPPVGSVRQLSYRLRAGDGTRTRGVVNVAVKLEAPAPAPAVPSPVPAATPPLGQRPYDTCQTVIGIPVDVMTRGGDASASFIEVDDLTSEVIRRRRSRWRR